MTYKPFDLTGKVGLVTGGNGGIGLGMARAMAQAGASVAIWGTNAQKNDTARAELEALGGKVLALQCDVGDEKAVDAAFAETVAKLGRVDSCFANAGVSGKGDQIVRRNDHRRMGPGHACQPRRRVLHLASRVAAHDCSAAAAVRWSVPHRWRRLKGRRDPNITRPPRAG